MTTKTDAIILVTPLLKTIINVVTGKTPLEEEESSQENIIEDTKFERSLCGTWDLTTVHEYAQTMQELELSRLLLKVIMMTSRPRTRELSMGILANLACHEDIKQILMNDKDMLLLCRSLLWYENDARVLLETTRLLNTFFNYVTSPSSSELSSKIFNDTEERMDEDNDGQQQQNTISPNIIEHEYLNLFLIPTDKLSPSIYHQYTQIIINTLHTELLNSSLQLLTSITIYIHGITLPTTSSSSSSTLRIQHNNDNDNDNDNDEIKYGDQNEKLERKKLIQWAIERLNEETKGIGIGMGLNGAVSKSILHLVWTFLSFHLLDHPHHYLSHLNSSLVMITNHLHEQNDFDKTSDEQDIECLVNALHDIKL
ncbi:unnamed protein product [Cunninghamella blakesleeana]